MSFDLAFWRQESIPTAEEAAYVYDQLVDGLMGVVDESPAIDNFYQSVISVIPDLTEENMEDSPWASPLYVTGECVIAAISWSQSKEVSSLLLDLASGHGLIAYDPQEQLVHGAGE